MPLGIFLVLAVVAVIALPAQARSLLKLQLSRASGGSPAPEVVAPVYVEIFPKPRPPAPSVQLPCAGLLPSVPLSGESLSLPLHIRWVLLCGVWPQQAGVRVRIRFDMWEEIDMEQRPAVVVKEGLVALDLVLVLFVLGRFDGR